MIDSESLDYPLYNIDILSQGSIKYSLRLDQND